MKISLIPFLLLLGLFSITSDKPIEKTSIDTVSIETEMITEVNCSSTDPVLCSCIAAGGCEFYGGSKCRIEFCSGTVEVDNWNSRAGNITVINQLCEE